MAERKTAVALIVIFVAVCLAMHLIQPQLSPIRDAVSFYMVGRLGWVMGFGAVALGVGSLIAVRILHRSAVRRRLVSLSFLAAWGAGCIVAGIFPPDPPGHWDEAPSFSGVMHSAAAMVLFLSFPFAAWGLSGAAGFLRHLALVSVLSKIAFFACLAPAFDGGPPFALGLSERVVLAVNVAWLLSLLRLEEQTR